MRRVLEAGYTLSAETAVALARVLGSTPEFWLRREAGYRAALARRERLEQGAARSR